MSVIFHVSHICVILLDLCYGFPRVREYMNKVVCVSSILLASTNVFKMAPCLIVE